MKLLKSAILLLATSFMLSSCGEIEYDPSAIYTPQLDINEKYDGKVDYSNFSFDDYSITINPVQFKSMLDNKEDFAFYFHNRACETCEKIKPLLIRYVLETKNAFYSLDIGNDSNYEGFQQGNLYNQIKDANDNYFFVDENGQFSFATPEFYFIKDGAISKKQLVTTNMFNYKFFKKVLNKYLIPSTSYVLITDDINKYRYVYYCDFSIYENNKLYKEIISNSEISLAISRIKSDSDDSSKIVDHFENEELIITNSTTLADVLTFCL